MRNIKTVGCFAVLTATPQQSLVTFTQSGCSDFVNSWYFQQSFCQSA